MDLSSLRVRTEVSDWLIYVSHLKFLNHLRRFPFDQIFWFEIPSIPCDKLSSIFRFVGLTSPRSSGSKFRAKLRNRIFVYLCFLALGLLNDSEVQINGNKRCIR